MEAASQTMTGDGTTIKCVLRDTTNWQGGRGASKVCAGIGRAPAGKGRPTKSGVREAAATKRSHGVPGARTDPGLRVSEAPPARPGADGEEAAEGKRAAGSEGAACRLTELLRWAELSCVGVIVASLSIGQ